MSSSASTTSTAAAVLTQTNLRRAALVAALAGGLVAYKQQQDAARKKARAAKEAAAAAANGGEAPAKSGKGKKKGKGGGDPMAQIFWRLWPFGHSAKALKKDPDAKSGQLELIAIFAMSVLRTWHQNRMVYVKRDLMQATYQRDQSQFRSVIRQTVILSVLSSVIFATHRFLKERLTLVWRQKLTRQLHRQFFSNMMYYKISHMNKGEIADVEERITRDPRRFCKGLADEMEKLSASLTSGIFFTYKLATISSPLYAVSPLIYFYIAFQASVSLAPNWSKRWRTMLDKRAIYQKNHARLLSHSEAIAAYQGGNRERAIIEESWSDFLNYVMVFVRDAALFQFVTSALFEYGGHSFAQALIVGKFVAGGSEVKEALRQATTKKEKVAANAELFSHIRFVTEYFIRAMSAQGTIIAVLRTLMNMKGPAKRLTELFNTMDEFERKKATSTTFINNPKRIEFKDVQVYTPTGHLLIKDLNFHIDAGTSMLLTGVNGSGKSSTFRTLGSLWPVPEPGTITKPGGGEPGLNKEVFYLPQKPYVALGSLQANMLYPLLEHQAEKIPDEQLEALMHKVDLGYLLDREDVRRGREVNWDSILSMGEKQRLAMARVFFHKPQFLILDECSSGVSASLERRFYEQLEAEGVTCITISHRPVLERYHDVVLNILGDGEGGWEWRETKRGKAKRELKEEGVAEDQIIERAAKAAAVDSGESAVGGYSAAYLKEGQGDALLERERLRKRSAPYAEAAEKLKATTDKLAKTTKNGLPIVSTRKRLVDLMRIFLPQGLSMRDTEAKRVLLLASLIVGKTFLADAIARFDGYILSTVTQDSFGVFARAMISGALARTFLSVFDALLMKHKWFLNMAWRSRLTKALMDLYFKSNVFYDVQNHDTRIDDPDERIAEQVETLSISLTELWTSLLKPAFDITFNSIMLYRVVGAGGMTYVIGYMGGAAAVMRFIVPNFRAIQRKEFELEGRFRAVHNRLTVHTESVAFFGGDDVEREIADGRLDDLAAHIKQSQILNFRFQLFQNFSIKQTPDLVAFALRMLFAQGFHSDDSVLRGDGSYISSMGEYIQQIVMATFKSFGDAFDLAEQLGQFVGTLENVTDFYYVLQELSTQHVTQGELRSSEDGSIEFHNVDIVAPGNLCVASNLNFKVNPGHSLLVTGPTASGKSSLQRVLAGLWPIPPKDGSAFISRPCGEDGTVTPAEVFLVPQKPYSVQGSLASQICYPEEVSEQDFTPEHDKHFRELLSLVGVEYLVDREGGWFAVAKWEDTLSLGEQQRIGMARLFYHEPKFAVIDEATSAVSVDAELKAYQIAAKAGITLITISQRLALPEYHEEELRLGDEVNEEGWEIGPISK
ncbi:ABC transporter ATP-binding protein [Hondaea fermentalgiana]|uniref:ABC transporter ATP-binding protein n=1 Tax=Hondaea fermentalgiana TaxID=2315210 RepID=A0A2R5G3C5_9STRA|nr:ABC transporter ATP-binding protein [Hondaea fermentalgiana]|eukprot:GBG25510.1 ABC transporter ATP-binding protein [Hondaea fermentalgiana]